LTLLQLHVPAYEQMISQQST